MATTYTPVEPGIRHHKSGSYQVFLVFNGKINYLGSFATLEEAQTVKTKARELWPATKTGRKIRTVAEAIARMQAMKAAEDAEA